MTWIDRHDVGAQLDSFGLPTDRGERGERVEGEDVRKPEAVEVRPLGLLRGGERLGERDRPSHADEQPNPHAIPLSARRPNAEAIVA